jgi:predicted permease
VRQVLLDVLLPIFLIVLGGYAIQKRFRLDDRILVKLVFYLFTPSLLFTSLYRAPLSGETFGFTLLFAFAIIGILALFSFPIAWVRRHRPSLHAAFALSIMFYNSGNYGLPVIELAFAHSVAATSVQAIVMTVQSIVTFSVGVFLAGRTQSTARESAVRIGKYPIVYAVAAALAMKFLHVPVWDPLWVSIHGLAQALVPVALATLGMQLAHVRLSRRLIDVVISAFLRLIIGPLIAFALIRLFPFSPLVSRVLVVSTAMPTAVNTVLLAVEMKNEPEFASQAVMFSTLVSLVTVPAVIVATGFLPV